ncbi:MAG: AAA family ATPase, partial [Vicinamibacteria bacterium]
MSLGDIISRLDAVRRSGNGYSARCPAHDDRKPSLSISKGVDGRVLLKCHAGCSVEAIVDALGLSMRDLFPEKRYQYRSPSGEPLYEKVRVTRPNGDKEFYRDPPGKESSLYGQEHLSCAKGQVIYLSESERDADAVVKLFGDDVVALSSGGANVWRESYAETIAKAQPRLVGVLQHSDHAGKGFAINAASSLSKRGLAVKIVSFGGNNGFDVADWISDGGTLDGLLTKLEAQPEWVPKTQPKGLPLMTLRELLKLPDEQTSWVWGNRIPTGGLAGFFSKPKVGKSTLTHCLALAISRGEQCLGLETKQGPVIYLAHEDKAGELKKHFKDMGGAESDPIHLFVARAPEDALAQLRVNVQQIQPVAIFIDTLGRFVRVKDGNDYSQ